MHIVLAHDHAGAKLLPLVTNYFETSLASHWTWEIIGADPNFGYPYFAHRVARAIDYRNAERGILMSGSGVGMAMTANRHRGVRAVQGDDPWIVRMAREHNDANVLCLGARFLDTRPDPLVLQTFRLLDAFFVTQFSSEDRHQSRVKQIDDVSLGLPSF